MIAQTWLLIYRATYSTLSHIQMTPEHSDTQAMGTFWFVCFWGWLLFVTKTQSELSHRYANKDERSHRWVKCSNRFLNGHG